MSGTQPLYPSVPIYPLTKPNLILSYVLSLGLVLLTTSFLGQENEQVGTSGWGLGAENQRFQPATHTDINRNNVDQLELKWVYGFDSHSPRSYPHVTDKTIYIGNGSSVVALDRETGAENWRSTPVANVTTAIVRQGNDDSYLYFGADTSGVYAINSQDGSHVWQTQVEGAITPRYSGSLLVADQKLIVPLSSYEIGLTMVPFYGCCKSSGGVAALDLVTGALLWYLPSIQEPAKRVGRGWMLTRQFAPSGAPVWSAPTYDAKRDRVYFATGQNYSRPTSDTSDAILAADADTGELLWVWQATANDAYNLACDIGLWMTNCFEPKGPDVDFGGPPVLATTPDGQDRLYAGQKSGDVHALDPDTGELIWTTKVGRGGMLGGVHFGIAVNPELNIVYAPISDIFTDLERGFQTAHPGVHALDMVSGELLWSHEREQHCQERHCWPGVSAALLVTSDLVFGATLDGKLFALDGKTGEEVWKFNALKPYESVNGVATNGGAFDSHGPMVVGSNLIVSSGYGQFNQMGGNALLVFELSDE